VTVTVDTEELEAKVKDMYRDVAERPEGRFHFELGAPVALRAGYDADRLAAVPAGALESSPASASSSTWPTCASTKQWLT